MTREITYFSLLRPLSEFQIAAFFSKMTAYHQLFSSCNRGYKITGANESKWCGECDKCRFVFLALSPFLAKQTIAGIFGRDLFADMANVDKFKELLGLEGHKPFECVGEYEESQAALYLLAKSPEWQSAPVIWELMRCAKQKRLDLKDSFEKAVRIKADRMPERYREAIDEISRLAGKEDRYLGSGRDGLSALGRLQQIFPGKTIIVYTDQKAPEERIKTFEKKGSVAFASGNHFFDILSKPDVVIRSPGISLYREDIKKAEKKESNSYRQPISGLRKWKIRISLPSPEQRARARRHPSFITAYAKWGCRWSWPEISGSLFLTTLTEKTKRIFLSSSFPVIKQRIFTIRQRYRFW